VCACWFGACATTIVVATFRVPTACGCWRLCAVALNQFPGLAVLKGRTVATPFESDVATVLDLAFADTVVACLAVGTDTACRAASVIAASLSFALWYAGSFADAVGGAFFSDAALAAEPTASVAAAVLAVAICNAASFTLTGIGACRTAYTGTTRASATVVATCLVGTLWGACRTVGAAGVGRDCIDSDGGVDAAWLDGLIAAGDEQGTDAQNGKTESNVHDFPGWMRSRGSKRPSIISPVLWQ
jgi:hypothetical protein